MRLFLSYRRADSAGHTGRLSDALAVRVGADHVFQDVETMTAGVDFVASIAAALDECDAVLAVIGPTWSTAATPDGSLRLHDPDDVVRMELATALRRDIPVVPVLVGGASLPNPEALPEDLRSLVRRQAVSVRDGSWQRDVDALLTSLASEPRRRIGRRRSIIALAVLLTAVAVVVAALAARQHPTHTSSSLPVCPTIDGSGMVARQNVLDRPATVPLDDGTTYEITVLNAYTRVTRTGHWQLLIRSRLTNRSASNDVTHASYQYAAIAVAGTPYKLSCFGITAGQTDVLAGLNSEAVLGADITNDPAGELTLLLDPGPQLTFAQAS